ncbi:hypothetical protein [Flavobacterium sp.]|uniref:hypothetical protein n=1 Tax=Flavobacterium sp. TaxID=239 RepID=UPI0038FCE89B
MKRIFGTLILMLVLNGCDDGNLILETINFEDATTLICSENDIIYKLNDKEALLLEIPSFSFENEPTPTGKPIEITISTTNRVLYRFYDGKVASDNICETIRPATPIVIDQWEATGGTIQITTTAIRTTNATTNSSKITGYNHNIIFKNITFEKKIGTQVYDSFTFGDYVTTITPLAFDFEKTIERCSSNSLNLLYDFKSNESLTLEIDPVLLLNEPTPLNSPRKGLIGETSNILSYRLFSGLVSSSYFCNVTTPSSPAISQEWKAVSGVSDISGIIEVTTTTNGTGYKHTIVMKKATLKKGNSEFYLGDSYTYGELLTN